MSGENTQQRGGPGTGQEVLLEKVLGLLQYHGAWVPWGEGGSCGEYSIRLRMRSCSLVLHHHCTYQCNKCT